MIDSFIKINGGITSSTKYAIRNQQPGTENNPTIFHQINHGNFFSNVQTYVRHKSPEGGLKKGLPLKALQKVYSQIGLQLKKSHQKEVPFTKSHKKVLNVFMFYIYIIFPLSFSSSLLPGCLSDKPNVQSYVRHKLISLKHSLKVNYACTGVIF